MINIELIYHVKVPNMGYEQMQAREKRLLAIDAHQEKQIEKRGRSK